MLKFTDPDPGIENTMADLTSLFFDIGGVLGTDGWDHVSRKKAIEHFKMDWDAFEKLHAQFAEALDISSMTVEAYLEKTVFAEPRKFTMTEFIGFMKEESRPDSDSIALLARLSASKKYFCATVNNESRELNDYRLEKFGLAPYFSAFFSSGYMGVRKPDRLIYDRALMISHKSAAESVFIDDRAANLKVPAELGMKTIQFLSAKQLEDDLKSLGVHA